MEEELIYNNMNILKYKAESGYFNVVRFSAGDRLKILFGGNLHIKISVNGDKTEDDNYIGTVELEIVK